MQHTFCLASQNNGKRREFAAALSQLGYELLPLEKTPSLDVVEDGGTFVENALLKARAYATYFEDEMGEKVSVLADDSGVVVPALDGAPGLYSARSCVDKPNDIDQNTANNQKLQQALSTKPDDERRAFYYCCLVLLRHKTDPTPIIAEGRWYGEIIREARGEGGFGYDPFFLPNGSTQTAAEMAMHEKNKISHRGKALQTLIQQLKA